MPEFSDAKAEKTLQASHLQQAEDVAKVIAERYGIGYLDLTTNPIDPDALRLIPEDEAHAAHAVAFAKEGKKVLLASDQVKTPALETIFDDLQDRGYTVEQFIVSKRSVDTGLERYKDLSNSTASTRGSFSIEPARLDAHMQDITSLEALQEKTEGTVQGDKSHQATKLLEVLFAGSVALGASDIHLEPEEESVRIRIRLNGLLTDVSNVPTSVYKMLMSRLKILAGMKLNVASRAQDGRFTIELPSREIEIRASSIPGAFGESFVMRILDPERGEVSLEELGMRPHLLSTVRAELQKPNGMILTTGPTGSGKTTTLYAFIKERYSPETKIVTIEDPIEYKLHGVVQTQVEEGSYGFLDGLRSTLRQDPDIIMLGEIRDRDVAETALQAALTGHLVFSTLHTNSAAGTFPRLIDLGLDPKNFSSGINLVLAQRLVRKINPKKAISQPLSETDRVFIEKIVASLPATIEKPDIPDTLLAPEDPEDPESYRGRIGVFEAIVMNDALAETLRNYPNERDIQQVTVSQGFLTMLQDGVLKVIEGKTTLDELHRVLGV